MISVTDPSGTAETFTLSVSHGDPTLGTTTGLTSMAMGPDRYGQPGPSRPQRRPGHADLRATSGYHGPDSLSLSDEDTTDDLTAAATVAITVNSSGTSNFTGLVFADAERTGSFASGDPTLGDVTITLTNTATSTTQTVTTDGSGAYSFAGVAAGTYNVSASFPAYLQPGKGILGTGGGGTVNGEEIESVTVTSGTDDTGYDFDATGIASQFITIRLFLDSTPPLQELLNPQPSITTLPNQAIDEGGTIPPLPFSVSDPLLSVSTLSVSSSSSNTGLVPDSAINSVGDGGNRTLTITPAANHTGTATITTTVSDPFGNSSSTTFTVTVSNPSGTTEITPEASALVSPVASGAIFAASVTTPAAATPAVTTRSPAAAIDTSADPALVPVAAASVAPAGSR